MQIFVDTAEVYISPIPEERRDPFRKLLETFDANLPKGVILDWFVAGFPNHSEKKVDMGKSYIRLKSGGFYL